MSERVYLNVYDLAGSSSLNDALIDVGFGTFHSGIEVYGEEFTFAAGGGIVSHTPRAATGHVFRSSSCIGATRLSMREVEALIGRLRPAWPGDGYDPLRRNCNSFSDALCRELVGWGVPGYVNRLAGVGAALACLLPSSVAARVLSAGTGAGAGAAAAGTGAGTGGSSSAGGRPFAGDSHRTRT